MNYLDMDYYSLIEVNFYNIKDTLERDCFLEALWIEFANTPINEEEEYIEDDFYIFKKGEFKEEIWHWFDDMHSKGLARGLMGLM